jgi:RNA polymerase sigma-70 factor (ECF subfamily)
MENIELWKDFVEGNAEAYSQIYRIYYPMLYSYGLKLAAGDQELVKDVIQELFIKLILNHRNLYATQHVSAYLLSAFRHKLIDAIQSMHPRESIDYIENRGQSENTVAKLFSLCA